MYRIPRIRAVSDDKRLTQSQIKAVLAKTSLSGLARRDVADAFSETGLLSDSSIKAAAAKVSEDGRYSVSSIDVALSKCRALKDYERIEIKGVLAWHSLGFQSFDPARRASLSFPVKGRPFSFQTESNNQ
jgi:hypothetical protein